MNIHTYDKLVRLFARLFLFVLTVGGFPVLAQEVPEVPDHLTYTFPTYFPKNGQIDFASYGTSPGDLRNVFENYYEGWWREASYHRANPTNGLSERGFFMDTKTVGEVALPWAMSPGNSVLGESNVYKRVVGTASADLATVYSGTLSPLPVGGEPIVFEVGTRKVTSANGYDGLRGDGSGFISLATGDYSFELDLAAPDGTPIEVTYTAYIQGAAPSPANWANFSQSGEMTDFTAGIRGPDGRGEHFMESPYLDVTAVLYTRWDAAANSIVDDPLVDGFWTPGEQFTDRGGASAPNGRWEPYLHAENRWIPAITNWGIADTYPDILPFGLREYIEEEERGDFFVDYNLSIREVDGFGRVLAPAAGFRSLLDLNVTLQVADRDRRVNVATNINEFNLTPPRYFRSQSDVVSTNITEDSWVALAKSTSSGTTASLLFDAEMPSLLANPRIGGVIADYTLNIAANTNQVNALGDSRVTTVANLAYTNSSIAPFYVADFSSGTNRPIAINSLDLTPPLFYTNFPSGVVGTAEDRWEPQLNFSGIAANLQHLQGIRAFFNATNGDGERFRGSALLDYSFIYDPSSDFWGANPALVGTRNVNIVIADIGTGANVPFAVEEMDLTPPLMYNSGTPIYGLTGTGLQTVDPGAVLEGDASHRYIFEGAATYADIPNLERFEVNFLSGGNPAMQDSGTNVTIRVYLDNNLYAAATASPGVEIRWPIAGLSANRFLYDGTRVQILGAGSDFWTSCVEGGVLAYPATDWAELPIPLYHAEPLWGEPVNTAGADAYLNTAAGGASVANPFQDAVGNDDQWTPGQASAFTPPLPYYGTDGVTAITNDSDPVLEGDAPYDNVSTAPIYADIPSIGRFEYQVSSTDGRPLVYLSDTYIEVKVLLPSTAVNQLRSGSIASYNGAVYDASNDRIVVTNAPGYTDNTRAFASFMRTLASGVVSNSVSLQYPAHLRVPVFYAEGLDNLGGAYRNLWGAPASTNYLNAPTVPGVIDSPFTDSTPALYGGPDNQWTPFFPVTVTNPPVFFVSYNADGTIQTNNNPLFGDASWTYERDNTAPPVNFQPAYDDIGTLGRIEYNHDPDDTRPHVYLSDYTVVIETFVDLSLELFAQLEANEGTVFQGFVIEEGVLKVPNPSEDFFGSDIVAGSAPHNDVNTVRRRAEVYVPMYYSAQIWGEPEDAVEYTNDYASVGLVDNRFLDAIGDDQIWTAASEQETFTDFIPIWDPEGDGGSGGFVPGLIGPPNNGVLPLGAEPTADFWSWSEYTAYIANNYPGDVAGLIARADNNLYDGPERWLEAGNNQMIQYGYDPVMTVLMRKWDFSVAPGGINSYEDWWVDRYGAYGSTSAEFEARLPNIQEWNPEFTDFDQVPTSIVSTNVFTNATTGVITTNTTASFPDITHPPAGTTWTYDAPREFEDLPSSLHVNAELGAQAGLQSRYFGAHNPQAYWSGGDLRLGEVTSPWNEQIWGEDRGTDDPERRNLFPDDEIRMAGPLAHDVYANFGYDAANQLNLEFVTHRRDGQNLTGPRGGHAKPFGYNYMARAAGGPLYSFGEGVLYARDHRDVNLTGLIDQGETIPHASQNYMFDPQADSPNNGRSSMPIFGWGRVVEHLVAIYDSVENFSEVGQYAIPTRTGTSDLAIAAPTGFRWVDGFAATNTLANLLGSPVVYADFNGSGAYDASDALWADANNNGLYDDIETLIHNPGEVLGANEQADGAGAYTAQWADVIIANGVFDNWLDLAWLDTMAGGAAGVFDSEPVLSDVNGILQDGVVAQGDRAYDAADMVTRSIYVYPSVANFSLMWAVTNSYSGTNEVYLGTTNGVDLIYREPSFTPVPGANTGVLWTGADVVYFSDRAFAPAYLAGDSVFIDINGNGQYDGDMVVSRLSAGLQPAYSGLAADGTFNISYTIADGSDPTAPGFIMGDGYDRTASAVWLESLPPATRRNGELLIRSSGTVANGTPATADISDFIQWVDQPIGTNSVNGAFDAVRLAQEGELSYAVLGDVYVGDALFYDNNLNGLYDFGATISRGVYIASIYNAAGIADPGAFVAGHTHTVPTRDGVSVSGFSQVEFTSAQPGLLTHEQAHDLLGYPDLYDYDVSDPEVNNEPIGSGDLMASSRLIHGYPDLKFRSNLAGGAWPAFNAVDPVELNTGASALLTPDGTPITLTMYPVERHADQYYVFRKEGNPLEFYTLAYNAGPVASPYANTIGRGLQITKSDYATSDSGRPMQQRSNNRYTHLFVQADAAYDMEDGTGDIGPEDAFGNTPETRVFTAHTRPPAVWWDGSGSGMRILDIRIPEDPFAPAEIDIQWVPITSGIDGDFPVHYDVPLGFDSDGDGIPDAWESFWFSDYPNPLALAGVDTDYDLDGLSDYYEWLAGSDPTVPESWQGAINPFNLNDGDLDIDGDGLQNSEEESRGTHPRLPDTADNGLLDGDGSDMHPSSALVPFLDRVLLLDGSMGSYVETPDQSRFALDAFTVQAWVNPTVAGGDIIARQVEPGVYNYRLALLPDQRLQLRFTPATLAADVVLEVPVSLGGIPLNEWTHVAGAFNPDTGYLRIYINGYQAASLQTGSRPALDGDGPSWTRLGAGFEGMLDEVLFAATAYDVDTVIAMSDGVANVPYTTNLAQVAYYRFEDGTSATGPDAARRWYGTSMNTNWYWGQVEDYAQSIVVDVAISSSSSNEVTESTDTNGVTVFVTNTVTVAVTNRSTNVVRTYASDWLYDWRNSATLVGGVNMTNAPAGSPVLYAMMDSNRDGIPDWWYQQYGYDPNGESIAYADPDIDGLTNYAEYLAGTDPLNPDTAGDGFGDYDSRAGLNSLTWGELYMDGDNMPDSWEAIYNGVVTATGKSAPDMNRFDAWDDPDEDDWSNRAEYLGSYLPGGAVEALRSPSPVDNTQYPMPEILVRLRYSGEYGTSIDSVVSPQRPAYVHFYRTPERDGHTAGELTMTTGMAMVNELTEGRLIEGTNYVFAFLDANNNGLWDSDWTNNYSEPAGITAVDVGWDDGAVAEIELSHEAEGYWRFSWQPQSNKTEYAVHVRRGDTTVLRRTIIGNQRTYFHEGDYQLGGLYGLEDSGYSCLIWAETDYFGIEADIPFQTVYRINTNTVSAAAPVILTPQGVSYIYSQNEVEWTMDPYATLYTIQIATTNGTGGVGTTLLTTTRMRPTRDVDGVYRDVLPFFAGDTGDVGMVWDNGTYFLRIQGTAASGQTAYSPWRTFHLNVNDPELGGASAVDGNLFYFGRVQNGYDQNPRYLAGETNMTIIVQAFRNASFSGHADAQVQVNAPRGGIGSSGDKGSYELSGLAEGIYYLRAFIDLNGNRSWDRFEPWGTRRNGTLGVGDNPLPVILDSTTGIREPDVRIVIRDHDADNDSLADGWEYSHFGTLAYGAGDNPDGDAFTNLEEYLTLAGAWLSPASAFSVSSDLSDDELVNLASGDPTSDDDGDGMTNWDEVLYANTDPGDAADVLRLFVQETAILAGDTGSGLPVQFSWQGKTGVRYKVYSSFDLRNWVERASYEGADTHTFEENDYAGMLLFYTVRIW